MIQGLVENGSQCTTVKSSHVPGMPLSDCSPIEAKARPDPATRSLTVWETTTSPDPA